MELGLGTTGHPHLDVVSLSSYITATQVLELPAWKGSLLRGLLGTFLKQLVCVFHGAPCGPCPLIAVPLAAEKSGFPGCPFPLYFGEARRDSESESGTTRSMPGSPFVLNVQCDGRRRYRIGEGFNLNLRLFGPAIPWTFHVLTAVKEGLATRHLALGDVIEVNEPRSGPATGGHCPVGQEAPGGGSTRVVLGHNGEWLTPTVRSLSLSPIFLQSSYVTSGVDTLFADMFDSVRVEFLTPFRVKERNTLTDTLPFSVIIRAALRRLVAVLGSWGTGVPTISGELVRASHSVAILEQRLTWQDMVRKSSRQGSLMRLGGVIGHVVYGKVPAVLVELLQQISLLHIGKQTSFGLGAIRVSNAS